MDVSAPYFDVDHEVGTVDPVSREGLRIRLVDGDKVGDEDDAFVEVVVILEVVDDDVDDDDDTLTTVNSSVCKNPTRSIR